MIDNHDLVLLDLDGVVYRGSAAVPGAVAAMAALRERGTAVGFVTNSAARTPGTVADRIRSLGIEAHETEVITSAQAGARLLRQRCGPGARVLVVGADGVAAAVVSAGLVPVQSVTDEPVALLQGGDPSMSWDRITEAVLAVQRGVVWVATNDDATVPTDRGLTPANGAAVAAVRYATGREPIVAGKPHPTLFEQARSRSVAVSPIFVGDRLDTDIAGARRAGMSSMLVLSGTHGARDLLEAPPDRRPCHVGIDLGAIFMSPSPVTRNAIEIQVGNASAMVRDDALVVEGGNSCDALWAAAQVMWRAADTGRRLPSPDDFLDSLGPW